LNQVPTASVTVGNVYRFTNVATGVDALLTVSALSGTGGTPLQFLLDALLLQRVLMV
jgi:hypothetical protein